MREGGREGARRERFEDHPNYPSPTTTKVFLLLVECYALENSNPL